MANAQEERDMLFARMAVDHKLVTEPNIRKAYQQAQALRKRGEEISLGEVLLRMKFLSQAQYEAVIRACDYRLQRREDKQLARILIDAEYAPQEPVLDSLKRQKDHYQKTGEALSLEQMLVQSGACNGYQLTAARKIAALVGEE